MSKALTKVNFGIEFTLKDNADIDEIISILQENNIPVRSFTESVKRRIGEISTNRSFIVVEDSIDIQEIQFYLNEINDIFKSNNKDDLINGTLIYIDDSHIANNNIPANDLLFFENGFFYCVLNYTSDKPIDTTLTNMMTSTLSHLDAEKEIKGIILETNSLYNREDYMQDIENISKLFTNNNIEFTVSKKVYIK